MLASKIKVFFENYEIRSYFDISFMKKFLSFNKFMKNFISSSTFAPRHDLCHFFSFSVKFPEDLHTVPTSTRADKCSKCQSYLLQSEHICPICDPVNYYQKKSTTFFNSFRININPENQSNRIFFIIFDIDLPIEELLSFSEVLIKEGKDDELSHYYFFGFLGYEISFLSCIDDQIQFLFIPSIKSFDSLIKPLDFFEKHLLKAIKIAKTYIKPATDKKLSIENLISFMHENTSFPIIQDIIYAYSTSFPIQIKYPIKPRFHLIQISPQISKLNTEFICRFKASFFSSPHVNESLNSHIKKLLKNEMILLPHLSITTSPGIVFKEFSGSVQSSNQKENNTNVVLFSCYSQSIPIFACSKMDKKQYNSNNFFSYQVVLNYFPDCIFVFNDVYPKAKTMDEWIQSFNRDFFLFTNLQSYANDLLYTLIHLTSPWRIINRNIKLGREFKVINSYSNSLRKFFNELFHNSSSFLCENQKAYILFYFCYGPFLNSINFISSLFGERNFKISHDSKIIFLNPFLIMNETISTTEIDKSFLESHPILVKKDNQQFSDLKNLIIDLQKELRPA